jgi:hypothetical protein
MSSIYRPHSVECQEHRWMMNWKGFERKRWWSCCCTISEFACIDWGKPRITSFRTAGVQAVILPKHSRMRVYSFTVRGASIASTFQIRASAMLLILKKLEVTTMGWNLMTSYPNNIIWNMNMYIADKGKSIWDAGNYLPDWTTRYQQTMKALTYNCLPLFITSHIFLRYKYFFSSPVTLNKAVYFVSCLTK